MELTLPPENPSLSRLDLSLPRLVLSQDAFSWLLCKLCPFLLLGEWELFQANSGCFGKINSHSRALVQLVEFQQRGQGYWRTVGMHVRRTDGVSQRRDISPSLSPWVGRKGSQRSSRWPEILPTARIMVVLGGAEGSGRGIPRRGNGGVLCVNATGATE